MSWGQTVLIVLRLTNWGIAATFVWLQAMDCTPGRQSAARLLNQAIVLCYIATHACL